MKLLLMHGRKLTMQRQQKQWGWNGGMLFRKERSTGNTKCSVSECSVSTEIVELACTKLNLFGLK